MGENRVMIPLMGSRTLNVILLIFPDKSRNLLQRYRTTEAGLAVLEKKIACSPKSRKDENTSGNQGGSSNG
jgi:hypothetical protein